MNDFTKSAIAVVTLQKFWSYLTRLYWRRTDRRERRREYEECNLPLRSCNYRELFVTHEGDVYPCCLVWNRPHMRIGHINDSDLFEKIKGFSEYCHCERYKFCPASGEDVLKYEVLNIEVSLLCQGKCAMCCVKAPDWHGQYDYYDSLSRLVAKIKPAEIWIQGGEVLVQRASIEWVEKEKQLHPEISWWLVTNGNVEEEMAVICGNLFQNVTVSMVGFQPETYRIIMGLSVERTKKFVKALIRQTGTKVTLKYLVTPLSLHEASQFLDWALGLNLETIDIADSGTLHYLNMVTPDGFWQKVIDRAGLDVRSLLHKAALQNSSSRTVVRFETNSRKLFGINDEFINESRFPRVIWRRV